MYILILVYIITNGVAATTANFNSLAACEAAGKVAVAKGPGRVTYTCAPKG